MREHLKSLAASSALVAIVAFGFGTATKMAYG
jgi:hypothetical protein